MDNVEFKWTDGTDKTFHKFYLRTENYYSSIVGGEENRKSFIPYNISSSIQHVLIAYINGVPIACSGLKNIPKKMLRLNVCGWNPNVGGIISQLI